MRTICYIPLAGLTLHMVPQQYAYADWLPLFVHQTMVRPRNLAQPPMPVPYEYLTLYDILRPYGPRQYWVELAVQTCLKEMSQRMQPVPAIGMTEHTLAAAATCQSQHAIEASVG